MEEKKKKAKLFSLVIYENGVTAQTVFLGEDKKNNTKEIRRKITKKLKAIVDAREAVEAAPSSSTGDGND